MSEINDGAFGIMIYNHRWQKKEEIVFWSKSVNVTIAAKAYKEKPITDAQRKSYLLFQKEIARLSEKAKEEVCRYFEKEDRIRLSTDEDLNRVLTLKTVIFLQDGSIILLLDSDFDEEHGLGIQIYPSVQVGPQDFFL